MSRVEIQVLGDAVQRDLEAKKISYVARKEKHGTYVLFLRLPTNKAIELLGELRHDHPIAYVQGFMKR